MKAGSQLLPVGAVLTSILSLQFGAAFATTLFSQIGPAGATTLRLTIAAIILGVIVRPRWSRWSNRQRKGIFALGIALAVMNGAFYSPSTRCPSERPSPSSSSDRSRWPQFCLVGGPTEHGCCSPSAECCCSGWAITANPVWTRSGDVRVDRRYCVGRIHRGRFPPGRDAPERRRVGRRKHRRGRIDAAFGVVSGGSELLDPTMLAAGAAVAVLSSVIPYSLEMWALRSLAKKVFAVLIALEPAAAALAGVLVIGQTLDAFTLVAIALVVTAGVGTVVMNRKPTAK